MAGIVFTTDIWVKGLNPGSSIIPSPGSVAVSGTEKYHQRHVPVAESSSSSDLHLRFPAMRISSSTPNGSKDIAASGEHHRLTPKMHASKHASLMSAVLEKTNTSSSYSESLYSSSETSHSFTAGTLFTSDLAAGAQESVNKQSSSDPNSATGPRKSIHKRTSLSISDMLHLLHPHAYSQQRNSIAKNADSIREYQQRHIQNEAESGKQRSSKDSTPHKSFRFWEHWNSHSPKPTSSKSSSPSLNTTDKGNHANHPQMPELRPPMPKSTPSPGIFTLAHVDNSSNYTSEASEDEDLAVQQKNSKRQVGVIHQKDLSIPASNSHGQLNSISAEGQDFILCSKSPSSSSIFQTMRKLGGEIGRSKAGSSASSIKSHCSDDVHSDDSVDGFDQIPQLISTVDGQKRTHSKHRQTFASEALRFIRKEKPSALYSSSGGSTSGDSGDEGEGSISSGRSAFGNALEPCEMLHEKYGHAKSTVIGHGATADVKRIVVNNSKLEKNGKVYAVKKFRRRRKNESERDYIKKVTSEFCISSSLHHDNVVETIDLVVDHKHTWCEVMEYCPGGSLFDVLHHHRLDFDEVNCCFKQLISGVNYLHSMGVAHRDLKPENLLFDKSGKLKISDFGVSDVFQTAFERLPHLSKGLCGSEPYIAPEEFRKKEYDARNVDIWACGVIYYAMKYSHIPWRHAVEDDIDYAKFLSLKEKLLYTPIEKLPSGCRELLYRILEPNPKNRINIAQIMNDPWVKSLEVCKCLKTGDGHAHHHICQEGSC